MCPALETAVQGISWRLIENTVIRAQKKFIFQSVVVAAPQLSEEGSFSLSTQCSGYIAQVTSLSLPWSLPSIGNYVPIPNLSHMIFMWYWASPLLLTDFLQECHTVPGCLSQSLYVLSLSNFTCSGAVLYCEQRKTGLVI